MKRYALLVALLWCGLVLIGPARICVAELPDPPPPRSQQEIERVLAKARKLRPTGALKQLNVLLVADKKDHGPGEHDYPLWQKRWEVLLSTEKTGQTNLHGLPRPDTTADAGTGTVVVRTAQAWPDAEQFAWADAVVVFCYINWDERRLVQLQRYQDRGGGFVLIHSATWTKPRPSREVAELTGSGGFTKYRHGPLKLRIVDATHPICLGLPGEIEFIDESYWPVTPRMDLDTFRVLAVSDEIVDKESSRTSPQPMFWTYERGGGRVFGCIPGHYNWTFDDPYLRLLLLRGIAWSAEECPYRLDGLAMVGVAMKE